MDALDAQVAVATIVFARTGAFIMLLPGFSSPHIPFQLRLFLALAIALALTPVVGAGVPAERIVEQPLLLLRFLGKEVVIGFMFGAGARFFQAGVEAGASLAATACGMGNAAGLQLDGNDPAAAFTALVALAASGLLFASDLHLELLRGIARSYEVVPVDGAFDSSMALADLRDAAVRSMLLTMQVAAPFLIVSLVVNVAIGLASKLVPQIPAWFMSGPVLIGCGLLLLLLVLPAMLTVYVEALQIWTRGG